MVYEKNKLWVAFFLLSSLRNSQKKFPLLGSSGGVGGSGGDGNNSNKKKS